MRLISVGARGFFLAALRLAFAASPLNSVAPNEKKPLAPRVDSSFKRFENCTVKLSAKETKWTSLEVKTLPTFLENFISKYDFGPVKLPGLSRNGPQGRDVRKPINVNPSKVKRSTEALCFLV